MGWFKGLVVTQGRRQHNIGQSAYDFLFDFHRNYASIPCTVSEFNELFVESR